MQGNRGLRKGFAVCLEAALLICCIRIAFLIRFYDSTPDFESSHLFFLKALLIAFALELSLNLRDAHVLQVKYSNLEYFLRVLQGLFIGSAALWGLYYLVPDLQVGRGIFGIGLLLSSASLLAWRALLREILKSRLPKTNMLVLGIGSLAKSLVREILNRPETGLRIRGFVTDNPEMIGVSVVNPRVVGIYSELPRLVANSQATHIAVAMDDRRGQLPLEELLHLKTHGVLVEEAETLYERITEKIAVESIKPSWLIFGPGFRTSGLVLIEQRILSLAVATLLLILNLPLLALIAILIKLDSRGPVFHSQERVGQDGKIFTIWKFRSMRENAECDTGPVWAGENDPRVTLVGRFLRRSRLDEFPQLFNVFRGDMNLVGPRPERPFFIDDLASKIPYYRLRLSAKPGLTGWAQINSGYANTIEQSMEKLQYDLYYIKNRSLILDAIILFRTVKIVLTVKGS